LSRYIGLDGFRWGWVAVWIDDEGFDGFDYAPELDRLLSVPHKRAMIDIPIGLPNVGRRVCDVEAQRLLGSSVFVGARRNLLTFDTQASANEYYWLHEGKGTGISCQLRGIRDKIKQVDDFITPMLQDELLETHPELIFSKLKGAGKLERKKSHVGRSQRIKILMNSGFRRIEQWLDWRQNTGIGRDDLIDACACAIAARDATSFLGNEEPDARGLRMQINY
jgi:predicted RNase H-like nuclease